VSTHYSYAVFLAVVFFRELAGILGENTLSSSIFHSPRISLAFFLLHCTHAVRAPENEAKLPEQVDRTYPQEPYAPGSVQESFFSALCLVHRIPYLVFFLLFLHPTIKLYSHVIRVASPPPEFSRVCGLFSIGGRVFFFSEFYIPLFFVSHPYPPPVF